MKRKMLLLPVILLLSCSLSQLNANIFDWLKKERFKEERRLGLIHSIEDEQNARRLRKQLLEDMLERLPAGHNLEQNIRDQLEQVTEEISKLEQNMKKQPSQTPR